MKDRFGQECGDPAPSLQELYDERDALLVKINAGDERAREMLPLVRAAISSREAGVCLALALIDWMFPLE